jgi:RNA polymerase sigma-70 factor (ECF subfamily)
MFWLVAIPTLKTGDAAGNAELRMDSDAFAAFYERSARSLWAYLARVSGNRALADDLMQEAYLRFLGATLPADGEIAARRYLFRIATNLLRDHWRRPVTSSIEEVPESFLQTDCFSGASEILGPALAAVSPRERQLLWLAYAEGYAHKEIAEITGLQSASIRLLLFRARRRVAKLLRTQGTADWRKP